MNRFLFFVAAVSFVFSLLAGIAMGWDQTNTFRWTHQTETTFKVYVDYGSGKDVVVETGPLVSSGGVFNFVMPIDRSRRATVWVTALRPTATGIKESLPSNSTRLASIPAPPPTMPRTTTTLPPTTTTLPLLPPILLD